MKNFKRKNGITLIALVITIIVMLILFAVTINIAVNGGLFGYAGRAVSDTETKKQEEKDWVNLRENMSTDQLIAKYTGENPDLALLRRYYIDGDETAIPNAAEDIKPTYFVRENEIIGYNNHVFKIVYNGRNVTSVDEIIGNEAFPYLIMAYGNSLYGRKIRCRFL